jgi:hypothetical protein
MIRPALAALCCTLLLTWLPSCDSVDEFIEHAGDAAKDVGDVVKDAVDEAKEHLPEDSPGTDGPTANRPPRPTGTITTGPSAMVASQVIDANGGTARVDKPGEPLDGLELAVPAGAYTDTRQVNISYAPVNGHTFGPYFNPATPLIIVENGGQYSDELMTVRIPADIPPDHFAMAFYYDEEAGTLEGIPFSSVESDSITIVTRHFSGFLVSIIKNTVLDDLMKGDIDSHFRPGIDDWQFTNFGSYIATGGHCAGQCLTALWYYCEQPDGQERTLNGRYDKNGVQPATPDLWDDDSHGYRLASTVQHDIKWSSFENKLMENLAGVNDDLTFKAFAYAIQLTGEPQEVGIFSSAGGGHDMICYRIYKNSLYIADPNFPGNTDRRIEFINGSFKPYESGANATEIANGNSKTYETIEYCAKSATIDWEQIGRRWTEFKAGTIGTDVFPAYNVVVAADDGSATALVNGFEAPQKRIEIWVQSTVPLAAKVFLDGVRTQRDADDKYELHEGKNIIGISVWGDANNDPQNRNFGYIDFKYFEVQYGTEECSGWVLESVTTRNAYVAEENEGWQDLTFTSSDGRFSGSGRYRLWDPDFNRTDDDLFATTSSSGTWTALPECIKADTPAAVQVQLSSSVEYDPMPDYNWSPQFDITITGPMAKEVAFHQRLSHSTPTAQQSEEAIIQIPAGSAGWNQVEVIIQVGTPEGSIDYVYTYVWRG